MIIPREQLKLDLKIDWFAGNAIRTAAETMGYDPLRLAEALGEGGIEVLIDFLRGVRYYTRPPDLTPEQTLLLSRLDAAKAQEPGGQDGRSAAQPSEMQRTQRRVDEANDWLDQGGKDGAK